MQGQFVRMLMVQNICKTVFSILSKNYIFFQFLYLKNETVETYVYIMECFPYNHRNIKKLAYSHQTLCIYSFLFNL